jgi:hypothetical protein
MAIKKYFLIDAVKGRVSKAAGITALALSCMAVLGACNGIMDGSNDDALYELAGKWYDSRYDFAFEITEAGEGYIAQNKTQCAVSVSGSFVYFRDSHGNSMGSFSYSIKNGELTMILGMGDFRSIESLSPFVKSGTIPSGGTVPVEFIGKWYAAANPPSAPSFEITKQGLMTLSGSATPYTVRLSGNTVALLDGSMLKGTFQYTFMYGEMIVTNGTEDCAGLPYLSPFIKKNS